MCAESPFDPDIMNWAERSQLHYLLGALHATPSAAADLIGVFTPGPKNPGPRSKPFLDFLARLEAAASQGRTTLFVAVNAIVAEVS